MSLWLQSELPGELVGRTEAEIERIVSEQIEQTLRDLARPEIFS